MLIMALDDEPLLLSQLERAIREAAPEAEVRCFSRASAALAELESGRLYPHAVFTDIEMPGMNGISLARRIKELSPRANVIFVTGFAQYAVESAELYASGYVLKPVTAERVRMELANLRERGSVGPVKRITARTFGNFDVFADGKPVKFSRSKAKEMLAYCIHRKGAACTVRELAGVLFEDRLYDDRLLDYLQKISRSMADALERVGAADVVIRGYNSVAVNTALIDCDYYRFEKLEPDALNAYAGEYMAQYSWAEFTAAYLNARLV